MAEPRLNPGLGDPAGQRPDPGHTALWLVGTCQEKKLLGLTSPSTPAPQTWLHMRIRWIAFANTDAWAQPRPNEF